MNTPESAAMDDLLAAQLAGQSPVIPEALRGDFEQALAAHAALREFLDETAEPLPSAAERTPPALSDDYRIERELGRGGMGVVYLVCQHSLNRRLALKVLRPGEQTFGPLVRRFLDEARHLARLRHQHIVSIHEVGEAQGEPYFTMDFIDGEPLSAVIARGPLSPTQAVAVLKQVAAAVQHAHSQGIVHRDLKPGNVLIDRAGHVFVTDFGLARDVRQSAGLTQSGELLGTPQYMAPEQARGQTALIGEATDIHALGLLLFEMLTGRAAFASPSPADILVKLLNHEAPALRTLDRRIPRDLETICQKMLQKSPANRYANVSALIEDIRRFEAGEPLIARRSSVAARALRWSARHWKIAATAVLTAALATAIVPPLFDKSFAELVAWGDEELARGNPETAATVYRRAFQRASESEKRQIADRIVVTCRNLKDAKQAVDLALLVVETVPDATFGAHDYLLAQALVARERARSPNAAIDIWHGHPTPGLKLVKSRLELALQAGLSDAQRREAEQTLTAVNLALSADKPWVRHDPEYLYTLPTGSIEELRAAAYDESQPVWNRGRAAFALGKLQQENGRSGEARAALLHAYDLMRRVYPMYGGIKASMGSAVSRVAAPDAEECRLVRELADAAHNAAPDVIAVPQGRVEFVVVGYKLPSAMGIDLSLELCDPSLEDPDRGLPHKLPRLVPVRQDAPTSIQVLDGTYRLRYRGHGGRWDSANDRLGRLLQVDAGDWPAEVEVRGDVVRLPPVRLRVAEEIVLKTPAQGAPVNLSEAELQWQPVPGAARYQVQLFYTTSTPTPTTNYFGFVTTVAPKLRLSSLKDDEKLQVRQNLLPGRNGGWRVDAYDEAGRCIGKSLAEQTFLVAGGLEQ
jgi:predicted Ser/Thr protein kinase